MALRISKRSRRHWQISGRRRGIPSRKPPSLMTPTPQTYLLRFQEALTNGFGLSKRTRKLPADALVLLALWLRGKAPPFLLARSEDAAPGQHSARELSAVMSAMPSQ